VERRPIVKPGLRQLLEIFDGLRRHVRPKFGDHFAFAGFDHCDFFGFTHGGGIFLWFFLFFLAANRRGDDRQSQRATKHCQFHA
jgi:hypothetical protein